MRYTVARADRAGRYRRPARLDTGLCAPGSNNGRAIGRRLVSRLGRRVGGGCAMLGALLNTNDKLLGVSIIEKLKERYGGNSQELRTYVSDLVGRAII